VRGKDRAEWGMVDVEVGVGGRVEFAVLGGVELRARANRFRGRCECGRTRALMKPSEAMASVSESGKGKEDRRVARGTFGYRAIGTEILVCVGRRWDQSWEGSSKGRRCAGVDRQRLRRWRKISSPLARTSPATARPLNGCVRTSASVRISRAGLCGADFGEGAGV